MVTVFCDYKDKVDFNTEKANKVSLAETAHSRTTLWCLLPGQHIHPHVHAGDHIWVVLEGGGNFLSDDAPEAIGPGKVLVVPAGKSHGVENTGKQGLIFISVSAG
ncbi:hypothetical protein DESUT3_04360 [Desulfuromonas versatilis]|uniref:Cupin type-2 domain-containing protein n=1 Tax=Desulfuromonas versatilis TaxID=2802975 RepID=A0ABN6DUF0_9BACT|nr:cupin domain-containing protein [Desulfuromonas versatilis]BCR03367.1 hypothetical protein DESUT3_04360 [Desulfuromonas versatilis]